LRPLRTLFAYFAVKNRVSGMHQNNDLLILHVLPPCSMRAVPTSVCFVVKKLQYSSQGGTENTDK